MNVQGEFTRDYAHKPALPIYLLFFWTAGIHAWDCDNLQHSAALTRGLLTAHVATHQPSPELNLAMRKLLLRLVIGLFVLLGVLSGVLVYFLHQPAFVKQQLQRQLANATGWELQIDGELLLHWGRNSWLELADVQLRNPSSADDADLFSARHLRLEWQPLKLLGRRFSVQNLELSDCQAAFASGAEGRSNWAIKDASSADVDEPSTDSGFRWKVDRLDMQSCGIRIASAGHDKPLELQFDQAELLVDGDETLAAVINGKVDQQELSLRGSLGPLPALWQGGYLSHAIDLQAGQVQLHSEGAVADFRAGKEADLNFHFTGPEFSEITDWLALPEFSSGAFDASISLHRKTDSGLLDLEVKADLGSLEIQGTGELDRIVAPTVGKLSLQVNGPDFDALCRTFGLQGMAAGGFALQVNASTEDSLTQLQQVELTVGPDRLLASGVLGPWPELKGSAVDIDLHSSELAAWNLGTPDRPMYFRTLDGTVKLGKDGQSRLRMEAAGVLGRRTDAAPHPFELSGELRQQGELLQLQQLLLHSGRDKLSVTGDLRLAAGLQGSELKLELDLADLASVGPWFGLDQLPAQSVHVQASVSRPGQGLKFDLVDKQDQHHTIQLRGEIPDLDKPLAMNATFDLQLPNLRVAQILVPDLNLPELPFSGKGEIRHDGKDTTVLKDVELALGKVHGQLQAELHLVSGLLGSTANWSLQGAELSDLWAGAPAGLETGRFTAQGDWQRDATGHHFRSLQFRSALADVDAFGHIPEPTESSGMNFNVNLRGEDASRFNPLLGPVMAAEPFSLQFDAAINAGQITTRNVSLRHGKTQVVAELDFLLGERTSIQGNIQSTMLDLTSLRKRSSDSTAERPGRQDKQARPLVFADEAIDLVGDVPVDLDLQVKVDRLVSGAMEFKQLEFALSMQSQAVQVSNLEFKGVNGGHYVGEFSSRQQEGVTEITLTTHADDLKLGFIGESGQDPATLPSSDIALALAGKGRTWHELAQTLDGKMRWYAGAGRVSDTGLDFLLRDLLTQIFSTLNPLSQKSKYTLLDCGVFSADFADGQVLIAPIVIQTDQITAFSDGQVDLSNETLNLGFRTVPRKGLGISASSVVNPFFKIGGTLMKPALELDVTKGAISGGAMVATVGLSVLVKSLSDRLLSSKDPCGDARAEIEKTDRTRKP
ncbi:MAG TPA: AsmA-like C-terminal region-containing protein [Xanthomonadales bacterium]|nr:AsmA-like C-terminal region-containing protein [Xanthomonadales bacterium]